MKLLEPLKFNLSFYLLLIFCCFQMKTTLATERVHSFGHNLSPTFYTLKKNQFTAGNYVLAWGITDNLSVATSPWMYGSYNMYSAVVKVGGELSGPWKWSIQQAYFDTFDEENSTYDMEAYSAHFTVGKKFKEKATFHLSLNYMYFMNETKPFSLRREPLKNQPYQFTLSSLFEIAVAKEFTIIGEVGVLGINYKYPQIISGVSMGYNGRNWLAQLGFSATGTPSAYFDQRRSDAQLSRNEERVKRDFSVHPEIQLQYFF